MATTDAPHPTGTNKYVLLYLIPEDVLVGTATEMVVVVAAAKADVVLVTLLPVLVMLHSSVKLSNVPGTVQLNLAVHD